MTVIQQIRTVAKSQPEGTPLAAKQFLHLGTRAAIDQALSRLVKSEELLRIGRGMYVRPIPGKFGSRPPEASKLIEKLAIQTGETVVVSESASANALGLSTQVPIRRVYLTSGRSRKLYLGKQAVELRHSPKWKLAMPNEPAGHAIRVLAGAGKEGSEELAARVVNALPKEDVARLVRRAPIQSMPTWLARQIGSMGKMKHA